MSATSLTLVASAAQVASGNGAWQRIPTLDQAMVSVYCTAGSAVTAADIFIQASPDGSEARAVDLVADLALKTVNDGTGGTVQTNVRDVVGAKNTTTVENFMAIYKHIPAGYVRAKWVLNAASLTFEVNLNGK